ncbi:MAG: ATP-grasp domain-containing protein, partial [Sphingomonadaceae bacterium]|nr:ATP-grasp domain-containing protein [Sphingomonadaceae bacterium]
MIKSPKIEVFWGPSIHSREAVVVAGITLDDLTIAQSPHIIETVTAVTDPWFPCKPDESCTNDAERLASFIVEWALGALTYQSGFLNARGYRATGPDSFALWLGFHQPRFSSAALSIAVSVCEVAATGRLDEKKLRAQLEALWKAASPYHPDTQAQILMEGARAMDLPYMPAWNIVRHWQFGWGAESMTTFMAASNRDGVVSNQVMANKRYSKSMIEYLGLPVPIDAAVTKEDEIPAAVEQIGFPCVVKPPNMGEGMGVSAGLTTTEQVRTAFRQAMQFTKQPVMIERHVPGSDHRLVIIDEKLVGVFRRDPPMVTGNGTSTAGQLIEDLNRDRAPLGTESYTQLIAIDLDETVTQHLERQGISADTVLPEGKQVTLKSTSNVAAGGT